jgi:hypothetical protein
MKQSRKSPSFLREHSLSLAALGVVILLIVLYRWSNPSAHLGSFFGNAIADWTGVFVTVVMTKFLYEKGSAGAVFEFLREHSLTLVLVVTGIGWVLAFRALDPESRWGQAVGNIVSEWTQILGLVLMTKRLIEVGSKEH